MADGTLFGRLDRPTVIDLFCGTGGTSLGVEMALGHGPEAAVNHWPYAIQIHQKNHPHTLHFEEDVFAVDPWEAARGKRVDLLVGSPDCTHFSVAKGAAPRDSGRRSLAEVFIRWAREIRPRVIILENVREFQDWGPLDESGRPIQARKGEDFRRWVGQLEAEGYRVEWRLLRACDFGAPTSRLRLFLVARCDVQAIGWPERTHGGRGQPPHRTAAECIDWSIPCPSIFDRPRPLAEATLKRIAAGVHKYVLNNPRPFLLCLSHGGRLEPIDEPLRTVTAGPAGGDRALVVPWLTKAHSHGWDRGVGPTASLQKPAWTVTTKDGTALCAAFLAKHYTGVVGTDLRQPLGTVTTQDHHSLVAATMVQVGYGERAGQEPRALDIRSPLGTVVSGGGKFGLVAAFLQKYYGSDGQNQPVDRPLDTATVKARFGLVTVEIGGENWALYDIGMRMLQPRELARAQGFPDSYILEGSKADQIAGIGNSVVPQVMAALVRANMGGA